MVRLSEGYEKDYDLPVEKNDDGRRAKIHKATGGIEYLALKNV